MQTLSRQRTLHSDVAQPSAGRNHQDHSRKDKKNDRVVSISRDVINGAENTASSRMISFSSSFATRFASQGGVLRPM